MNIKILVGTLFIGIVWGITAQLFSFEAMIISALALICSTVVFNEDN